MRTVAQGYALFAETCGSLIQETAGPRKRRVALRYMSLGANTLCG